MPKKRTVQAEADVTFNPGVANPKQIEFYNSEALYTCYGGAKGGGKTHAVRIKAILGALYGYPGIRILIIRAHYPELEMNHIRPICAMVLPLGVASYNGTTHILQFENGSIIKFGHWNGEESENEYNGQEFDWIFIDEATQFSERAFNFLGGCLRGTTDVPRRMYLTCNPGGVGHFWVKRLFIDKKYDTTNPDPEKRENPADYNFIFATVDDNIELLKRSPNYKKALASMPNSAGYRYGDWDSISGSFFKEFNETTHVRKRFRIPSHWQLYRSFDYGLDMLACFWWAVDEDGRAWCYKAIERSDLNVQQAAQLILDNTLPGENIPITYAPPDMWSRQRETGRTMAEIFNLSGLPIVRSDNNRVQGHGVMKVMMSPAPLNDPYVKALYDTPPATLPMLMFFDDVGRVISDIKSIQADEKNPNDCAKDPHEITHTVDGVRYFCVNRALPAEAPEEPEEEDDVDVMEDYDTFMTGGEITASYMNFG